MIQPFESLARALIDFAAVARDLRRALIRIEEMDSRLRALERRAAGIEEKKEEAG